MKLWISDRVIVAVCFRSPFLNPNEYMRHDNCDDKNFSFLSRHFPRNIQYPSHICPAGVLPIFEYLL